MSMSATPERMAAPRPLFLSLDSAIRCALRHGTDPERMIRSKWCETYNATPEQFETALTKALSSAPPNAIPDDIGEGK